MVTRNTLEKNKCEINIVLKKLNNPRNAQNVIEVTPVYLMLKHVE